jgi:hypothetical protein
MTTIERVKLVEVRNLIHIEGFSQKRVAWLVDKITKEGAWTLPLAIDDKHNLVLDGQHRLEAARILNLKYVPAVHFKYESVETWSLRPDSHPLSVKDVISKALAGNPYPYKTVKHRFTPPLPSCNISLKELRD